MKIAVLFGGISTERNVSISSGKAVVEALNNLGYEVLPIDPAFGADSLVRSEAQLTDISAIPSEDELKLFSPKNLIECVNSTVFDNVDLVFNVMHGKWGEDGRIQSLLEMRGIKYTGSGVKASALAMDKIASKMVMNSAGILTPAWYVVRKNDLIDLELAKEIRKDLGGELCIKPNNQGSTIGITVINDGNLDDIENGIHTALKYSDTVVVEEFIHGREITSAVVGTDTYPIVEIIPDSGFYGYEEKYVKGHTEYECPADIDEGIAEFTQNMSLLLHQVVGCAGFTRSDFRLDDEGQPYCLEINTVPGFTATSLVPKAAKAAGIEFEELCKNIINLALEK